MTLFSGTSGTFKSGYIFFTLLNISSLFLAAFVVVSGVIEASSALVGLDPVASLMASKMVSRAKLTALIAAATAFSAVLSCVFSASVQVGSAELVMSSVIVRRDPQLGHSEPAFPTR